MRIFVVAIVVGCGTSKPASPPPAEGSARPSAPALVAGPVPVTLPALEPAQRRTLTSASHGFLTIDARGEVRWGLQPAPGYAGAVLQRDDSAFAQLFPYPEDRGHEHHAFRGEGIVEADFDAVAVLSDAPDTEVLVVADVATPARITLRRALTVFDKHAVTLAAGTANTAVKYRLGGSWAGTQGADAIFHAGHLEPLGDRHPEHALLDIGDDTTTGDLVAALGMLGAAGVPSVRVHRVMGWGAVAPVKTEEQGPMFDDTVVRDRIMADTTTLGDPTLTGGLSAMGVESALKAWQPRFRFCYEARGAAKLHGTLKLAFDVGADGAISHAKATGLDAKVADCVQRAMFDFDITPTAITGAGHVAVDIAYAPIESSEPEPAPVAPAEGGYYCFIDGDISLCAPLQEQCEAARDGYTRAGVQFSQPTNASDCTHQKTAWTSNGTSFHATRKMCGKGCREVH